MPRGNGAARPLHRVLATTVLIGAAGAASLAFDVVPSAAQPLTTVTTTLSDGVNSGTTLTEPENTAVTDSATLSGDNAATAGGTVTYDVYSDDACSVLVSGPDVETVADGVADSSQPVSLADAGIYYWQVTYSGDDNNAGDTTACGSETETVSQATTSVSTSLSDGTNIGTALTEPEDTPVTDTATLSGETGDAAGTVTYSVYSDNACSIQVGTSDTVNVTDGSVPASSAVSLNATGTYYWQATYNGDTDNAGSVSTCASETETVTPALTSVATTLSSATHPQAENTPVTDSATLSGDNAATAGGTVTYTVYSDSECTDSDVVTSGGTVTVTSGSVPGSSAVSLAAPGNYYWQASYSGDANDAASVSPCGSEVESVYAPGSIVTSTSVQSSDPKVVTGERVAFTATVSPNTGGHPVVRARGTVTFTVTGHNGSTVNCDGTNKQTLAGNGTATCHISKAELLASVTPYSVVASYSGNSNFAASSSSPVSEKVEPAPTTTTLTYNAKPASGKKTKFTATISAGSGTRLLTGHVVFAISSTDHSNPHGPAPTCAGGNIKHLVAGVAKCKLHAGWFVVATPTSRDKHPTSSWSVEAVYEGNGNFLSSSKVRSGTVTG